MPRWTLLLWPLILLAWLGCEPREGDDSALGNRPPQTHLSVGYFRADSSQVDTLALSTSRVGLSWWGEDADGWVDHYLYRWSTEVDSAGNPIWHSTEAESDTFIVRLNQELMTVRFEVVAVDNEGVVDPTPAVTVFPAYNQKPKLDWVAMSQELLSNTTQDTSWTFGYNTFHFNAWDLDGTETITRVVWALDDTTQWTDLPLGLGSIPLTPAQLTPGGHRIFVKAQDIAQAWSEVLTYPRPQDTLSDGRSQVWAVKPLSGNLLVVFDDPAEEATGVPVVKQGLAGMGYQEREDYTFWLATDWLPYDDQDFQSIIDSYQMIFWFSWKNTQNETACDNLDVFMARGGRLLMTTTDLGRRSSSGGTYLFDGLCVPVDSLTDERDRILPSHPIQPTAAFAHYPVLHMREAISFMSPGDQYPRFGFLPDSSAVESYFVPAASESRPRATLGARVQADGRPDKAKQLYFSLPLHKADNLDSLFRVVIDDDFNW